MVRQEGSLLDLCGICYTGKPKYRCPRCKAQTCSLPCYKRHQQRASCNGKRDPAAYLKKSQLATPAGVDQDYNYLKRVEREIDHAQKDVHDRGIGDRYNVSRTFTRGVNPESALQRYLITNRIHVSRAPTGMSRQRTNQTRSTKRSNISWTVEWFDSEGSRKLQDSSLESSTLQELYDLMQLQMKNAAKRIPVNELPSSGDSAAGRKRKRSQVNEIHTTSNSSTIEQVEDTNASTHDEPSTVTGQTEMAGSDDAPSQPSDGPVGLDKDAVAQFSPSKPSAPNSEDPSDVQPSPETGSHSEKSFFYLLKPNTPSTSKVLIPLSSDATLTESLRDRTVLEYPTIYVLPNEAASLPAGFITEEDCLTAQKRDEEELTSAIQNAQKDGTSNHTAFPPSSATTAKDVDPNRILDMLKRDVSGLR